MLRFLVTYFLICAVVAGDSDGTQHKNLRGLEEALYDPNPYSPLVAVGYASHAHQNFSHMEACIHVENGTAAEGQPLILGDCADEYGGGWMLDDNKAFRSELNSSYCMQAGKSKRNIPRSGNSLRLGLCDSRSAQKFAYHAELKQTGLGIRPFFNQSLCVVWKGVNPEIGADPIILSNCEDVGGRLDWMNSRNST